MYKYIMILIMVMPVSKKKNASTYVMLCFQKNTSTFANKTTYIKLFQTCMMWTYDLTVLFQKFVFWQWDYVIWSIQLTLPKKWTSNKTYLINYGDKWQWDYAFIPNIFDHCVCI